MNKIGLSFLSVLCTFASVQSHAGTPVITGLSDIALDQQEPARLVSSVLSIAGGDAYTDGSITFSLAQSTSDDYFALTSDPDPDISGAISVDGSDIYLGNGSGRDRVGAIDAINNGQAGADLQILFSSPLANSSFETGDTQGWTTYAQTYASQTDFEGDSINWVRSGTGTSGTGSIKIGATSSINAQISVVTSPISAGTYALRLFSSGGLSCPNSVARQGTLPDGYCSTYGPYVESTPFEAFNGDLISVDWAAANGGDWYEVIGMLIGDGADDTFGTSDDTQEVLFAQRGDTKGFSASTSNISQDDTYKFQFISGTYDASGGLAVGASLYVDNARIISSSSISDAIALNIARLVSYQNTSTNPPIPARTLTVTAQAEDGSSGSATASITIDSAPVFSSFEGVRFPSLDIIEGAQVIGGIAATDPNGDTVSIAISGGADADLFSLVDGELIFNDIGGLVGGSIYSVEIAATANGLSSYQLISINVLPDLDGDGITDSLDDDVDGDGIPNDWEVLYGLNPSDASDGDMDSDSDGDTNLSEYLNNSNPTVDDIPPVVTAPQDLTINSTELFTPVTLGTATAIDGLDGNVTATPSQSGRFKPGAYTITWSATDAAGNSASDTQLIHVVPMVDFAKDQTVGEAGGTSVTVSVYLNGEAATYPVTVPYTVSGTATNPEDHNLANGSFVLNSGVKSSLTFDIVDDGLGDNSEQIILTLGEIENAVAGAKTTHRISITEINEAPSVVLSSDQQGSGNTSLIVNGNGQVVVTANVTDPNTGDSHTFDWSTTDSSLIDLDSIANTFTFDPASLPEGLYKVGVLVTDNGLPPASTTASMRMRVIASAPVIQTGVDSDGDGQDDSVEGFGDADADGIPDYLDAIDVSHRVEERVGESAGFVMETNPGLQLKLGSVALASGTNASGVSDTNIADQTATEVDLFANVGGYFDFDVNGLPESGQTVDIVVAQFAAIPADAVYRKFINGVWRSFIENRVDSIASAAGAEGYCPPPGDVAYSAGLTEGDWCVQLTIQDGGPNDADGETNGAVSDPGGVGTKSNIDVSSSGGSLSIWGLMLMLLPVIRKMNKKWLLLAAIGASSQAQALEPGQYELGFNLGYVHSDTSKSDLNQQLTDSGINGVILDEEASRMGFGLNLGYPVTEEFMLELGYKNLGSVDTHLRGLAGDVATFLADVEEVHPQSGHGFTFGTAYHFSLKQDWTAVVHTGGFFWVAHFDLEGPTDTRSFSDSGMDIYMGAGLERALASGTRVGLNLQRFWLSGEGVDTLNLSVRFPVKQY